MVEAVGTFSLLQVSDRSTLRAEARIPSGPSTSTVFGASALKTSLFRDGGGSSILKLTSAGKDSGAPPIREWHLEVLEKDLAERVEYNSGNK